MARQVILYTIFLGSTGETSTTKNAIRQKLSSIEVIDLAKAAGIHYDIKSGEDTPPQISLDGQTAINEDGVEPADLAIVVIKQKLGTQTERAASGSAEEAEILIEKWRRGEKCQLMLCFDVALDGSNLDPGEYQRVLDFKENVRELGVLTHDFNGFDELEPKIGPWVVKLLQNLNQEREAVSSAGREGGDIKKETELEVEEEKGILDLEEEVEDHLEEMNASAERIANQIELVGNAIQVGTEGLNQAVLNEDRREIRRVIEKVADDLQAFADSLAEENTIISDKYKKVLEFIFVYKSFVSDDENIADTLQSLRSLPTAALSGMVSASEMKNAIDALPKMTLKSNKAKRSASRSLADFIGETMKFAEGVEAAAS